MLIGDVGGCPNLPLSSAQRVLSRLIEASRLALDVATASNTGKSGVRVRAHESERAGCGFCAMCVDV